MTEERLAKLRRLHAKTAPVYKLTRLSWRGGHSTAGKVLVVGNWWDSQAMRPEDAAFIVAAHELVPALLDELDALRAQWDADALTRGDTP